MSNVIPAIIAVLVLVLVLVAFRRLLKKERRFQMTQTTVVKTTESCGSHAQHRRVGCELANNIWHYFLDSRS